MNVPTHTASSSDGASARNAGRAPAVRRSLLLILVLNVTVVVIKTAVGWRTRALTVLGAVLESSLDVANNVLGIILVGIAARGPDEEHPYGHEKFETLGALAIVGFLSISCFELLREGVRMVSGGHAPRAPSITEVSLIVLTMVVNVFVVRYERQRGHRLASEFLLADAAHTYSDIYVTAAALAALLLARVGLGVVDPVLAIAVALVIAYNGYEIVRRTVPVLVDARAMDTTRVRQSLAEIPEVKDVRTVRSRATASGVLFAEVTIAVDGGITVEQAHRVADAVEDRLARELGASEVTVHIEPA